MFDAAVIARKVLSIIGQIDQARRPRLVPTEQALSRVVEDVFWSSLAQFEGTPVSPRIFFAPSRALGDHGIIRLASPMPVSKDAIQRLSPAHAPDGALLVVEHPTGVQIEAILGCLPSVREVAPFWLCVESRGPGAIRVCIASQPILEFTRGTSRHIGGMSLDRTAAEALLMTARLFPSEPAGRDRQVASLILDLGKAIERLGRGGAIWILPHGAAMDDDLDGLGYHVNVGSQWWEPFEEQWESGDPISIPAIPPNTRLKRAAQAWSHLREDAVTRSLANLTQIDGAIVMNGSPHILAFGVICNTFGAPTEVVQPVDPSHPLVCQAVDPSVFGGSRHRSAIGVCATHAPAGALVASHDGGLTVFASAAKGRVIGSPVSLLDSDAEVQAQESPSDDLLQIAWKN